MLEAKKIKYLYRIIYYYKDYLYLIKLAYLKNQILDLSIQKQINKKLKNLRLKEIIRYIQKKQAKKALANTSKEVSPSVFTISICTMLATSNYYLQNSFILDLGVNIYVYNNPKRFQETQLALEEFLYTRNSIISIKGFRSIIISVQTLRGPQQIILIKVALMPLFYINIISLD